MLLLPVRGPGPGAQPGPAGEQPGDRDPGRDLLPGRGRGLHSLHLPGGGSGRPVLRLPHPAGGGAGEAAVPPLRGPAGEARAAAVGVPNQPRLGEPQRGGRDGEPPPDRHPHPHGRRRLPKGPAVGRGAVLDPGGGRGGAVLRPGGPGAAASGHGTLHERHPGAQRGDAAPGAVLYRAGAEEPHLPPAPGPGHKGGGLGQRDGDPAACPAPGAGADGGLPAGAGQRGHPAGGLGPLGGAGGLRPLRSHGPALHPGPQRGGRPLLRRRHRPHPAPRAAGDHRGALRHRRRPHRQRGGGGHQPLQPGPRVREPGGKSPAHRRGLRPGDLRPGGGAGRRGPAPRGPGGDRPGL